MEQHFEALKVEAEPHVKALLVLAIEKLAEPVIMEKVAQSETKIDDVAAAALVPAIKAGLMEAIKSFKL